MAAEVREGLRRRPALPGDQRALQSEASAFRFPKSRPGLLRQRSAGLPVGFRRSSGSGDSTGFQWRILGRGAAVPGDRFRPDASPAPGRGGRLGGEKASAMFASSLGGGGFPRRYSVPGLPSAPLRPVLPPS